MAKDGLWFPIFAKVNPETQVMSEGIWVTGIVAGFMACFVPLEALANLISLGTLMVFTFVDAGVILLRLQNVSSSSVDTFIEPVEKERERSDLKRNRQRVVNLLLLFILSLLAASLFLSHTTMQWPILLCIAISAVCGVTITYTPASWTTNRGHHPIRDHGSFQCPIFPLVPLAGAGFNSFMMGSLPLSSWFLCLMWVACGMTVYFSYGIHHSRLRLRSLLFSDTLPLMTHNASTTDASGPDYGGVSDR